MNKYEQHGLTREEDNIRRRGVEKCTVQIVEVR